MRLSTRKKASWVLEMVGTWWKGEPSPSIFILTSSFSMIFSNATCFVERIPWRCQQQCHEKAQGNGHEVPLAPRQRKSRPIQTLLGTQKRKQRRLCHQTSCPNTSSGNATNIPNRHRDTTKTTKETRRDTSCSKGVLDILRCI